MRHDFKTATVVASSATLASDASLLGVDSLTAQGARLTAYAEHVIPAPAESETVDLRPMFVLGQIVRWDSAKAEGHLHVVLADDLGRDVVKIARLGGNGGRALKIPGGRGLTAVDPAEALRY